MMYRVRSVVDYIPLQNPVWVTMSLLSMVLTVALTASIVVPGIANLAAVPWYAYFLAFAAPIILLPVQELNKMYDKKCYIRFQKRSKL
ncbi:hypothetical protein EV182_008467, partial [Spiromyces aspiralis]